MWCPVVLRLRCERATFSRNTHHFPKAKVNSNHRWPNLCVCEVPLLRQWDGESWWKVIPPTSLQLFMVLTHSWLGWFSPGASTVSSLAVDHAPPGAAWASPYPAVWPVCVCHTSQAVVYQDDCRVIGSDRDVCLCEEYLCAVTNKGSGFIDGDLVWQGGVGVLCTCVWLRNISIDLSGQGPFVTGRTYKCLMAQQAQTGMWFMTWGQSFPQEAATSIMVVYQRNTLPYLLCKIPQDSNNANWE